MFTVKMQPGATRHKTIPPILGIQYWGVHITSGASF